MIGERIKELRKELSMSQIEFAEYLEMKQNTLSGYEKRGKIPSDLLETIILKTGVNPDWLLTGRGDIFSISGLLKDAKEKISAAGLQNIHDLKLPGLKLSRKLLASLGDERAREAIDDYVFIDRVSVKASAGSGIENGNFEVIEKIPIIRRLVSIYSIDKIKFIEVSGNSMEPEYKHGSLILYMEGVELRSDDDYVINRNGELILKTIQFEGKDLSLISRNPLYPTKRITEDSQDNIHIVGRVIGKLEIR